MVPWRPPVGDEAINEKLMGMYGLKGVLQQFWWGDKISIQIADFTSDRMEISFRVAEFDSDNLLRFRPNKKFASGNGFSLQLNRKILIAYKNIVKRTYETF